MIRKLAWWLIVLAAGLIVAGQRQDIARYIKVRQMSWGQGHPENVPACGSQAYPRPGGGVAEGTGDFDSAGRGGAGLMP